MTGEELLDFLRTDVLRDRAVPSLWSDDLLYRYLSEAQTLMARQTYCLIDSAVPFLSELTISADTREYAISSAILHVLSARLSTEQSDLTDVTHARLPSHLESTTSQPTCYVLNETQHTITFYPTPDAEYVVYLRVARLPSAAISDTVDPEIPEHLHIDLAEYAAYRCLMNNDSDGLNIGAADRHKKDWDSRVLAAKREFYRLRMGNNPRIAVNWTGK